MDRKPNHRPLSGMFSGLNALETVVLAAIVLVALAGMLLVGKGLVLQSRIVAGPGLLTVATLSPAAQLVTAHKAC